MSGFSGRSRSKPRRAYFSRGRRWRYCIENLRVARSGRRSAEDDGKKLRPVIEKRPRSCETEEKMGADLTVRALAPDHNPQQRQEEEKADGNRPAARSNPKASAGGRRFRRRIGSPCSPFHGGRTRRDRAAAPEPPGSRGCPEAGWPPVPQSEPGAGGARADWPRPGPERSGSRASDKRSPAKQPFDLFVAS